MHPNGESASLYCCFCLKSCITLEDLQAHIGSEHFNYHPFTCAYCPEGNGRSKFSTKTAIKRHCLAEHGLTKFHIRLWVSDEVENDEKEIEKCMQRCVQDSIRNQSLALALPSQPFMIETQLVEFPSSEDKYSQAIGIPQAANISFITSSGGSNSVRGADTTCFNLRTNERVVGSGVGRNMTGENDEHTDSSSSSRTRNEEGVVVSPVPAASATAHITIIDEQSLNPFHKWVINPSPTRKRRHDMATPRPSSSFKQIAKKSHMQETEEKTVCNIRRQAFVNSSHISQLQLRTEQHLEERDRRESLTRSQHSLNSSGFNSSGLCFSNGSSKPGMLKCMSCKKFFRNQNYDLRSHINNTHLRLPLFSCAECHKHFFNRRSKAIGHIHHCHHGNSNLLIDNTAIYEPILAARLLEFFPDATIFPNRTSTPAHISERRVHGRARSVIPESHNQENSNFPSIGPAASNRADGNIQNLQANANVCFPPLKRAKSVSRAENKAARTVLVRGRSVPAREPSPLTNFAYNSRSKDRTEAPSTQEKSQLPSCFSPEYAASIYKGDRVKKIECGKCKTKVVAKLDWILFNHVNINHLKMPAFDCLACGESFCEYSGTSIKRHMKSYHSDQIESYQDNRPIYRSQLQEMCLAFFARK